MYLKNLSASRLLFNAETVIDDIVSHPYYDTRLEVRDINGASYFVTVPKSNSNDLIELREIIICLWISKDTHLVKLITYRTSILGLGKSI